jgi:carbonic anhydrase/acetyltransferase-like protein (isoleucine patch superfamily)
MGMIIPEGALAAGVPAKIIRTLSDEERKFLITSAQNYIDYVATYR